MTCAGSGRAKAFEWSEEEKTVGVWGAASLHPWFQGLQWCTGSGARFGTSFPMTCGCVAQASPTRSVRDLAHAAAVLRGLHGV